MDVCGVVQVLFHLFMLVSIFHPSPSYACPFSCECIKNGSISSVTCSGLVEDIVYMENMHITELKISRTFSYVPEGLKNIEGIQNLDLAFNFINELPPFVFKGLSSAVYLNISNNNIEDISDEALIGLSSLKILDLSHNDITTLPASVFHPLTKLEKLDLQYNNIEIISRYTFLNSVNIQSINLSYNRLSLIQVQDFQKLTHLEVLNLRNNLITHLPIHLIKDLLQIERIETDLSHNTLDCSCSLSQSLNLIRSKIPTFLDQNLTCLYPSTLKGVNLKTLNPEKLDCEHPSIAYISPAQSVLRTKEITLSCQATGHPKPGIVWITPWGHKFAHPSVFHDIGDELLYEASVVSKVYDDNKGPSPEVTVTNDGILIIKHFRGFLKGNFTCLAINFSGNDTTDTYLNIHVMLRDNIIFSLYIGAASAGGFLLVGLLGAAIRHSLNFISKARSDHGSVYEKPKGDNTGDLDDITVCNLDDDDDDNDSNPPSSPAMSRLENGSFEDSPSKCTTPNDPDKWLPVNIMETLDDVKWRLKYGVGRRMDKMRSHVQSIRSSGSLYVQSIRETSHVAVGRVRAGMVMGVEQMKYGMQSLKEFCGTGDLGQTISMISVSTDIDTNQKTEVIRSVTYV